jgi:Nuclease-related domain
MPGTVFPTSCPRPTTSDGERVLHARLSAQLPEGWFAWHSLALNVGASEWIGEADFVVACPTRGILVLEVKSGHVVRRGGLWLQNWKPMKRSPHDQARDFSYRLSKQIEAAGGGRVPFASACVFTNMKGLDQETSDEASGAVLHELDLENLGPALVGLFERLVPPRKPPMFALWKKALHGLWGDRWVHPDDIRVVQK